MRILKVTTLAVIMSITPLAVPLADHANVAEDEQFRRQAKRIFDRLTGSSPTNATIDAMATALHSDPSGKSAAQIAIQDSAFYNVTLKNWAAPWTNEAQTVFVPLNDYSASIVGMVRDGIDFRQVLHGDVLYRGNPSLGISGHANNSNQHYEDLEDLGPAAGNLADPNILVGPNQGFTQSGITGLAPNATAGMMTSRAASEAFFVMGTNRAMFRFTLMNHLCTDLEPLKDVSRIPDRVRKDVSRSPGGDSRIFLNACVGCHAGMDGLSGAFAYYEWNAPGAPDELTYTPNSVQGKYLINENNFEFGYETINDSWVNYWRNGPNSVLGKRPSDPPNAIGWQHPANGQDGINSDSKGNSTGAGAKSLGIELSNSQAFAQCQVDKAFKTICLRDPNVRSADRSARDGMVANFASPASGAGPYDMREVFTDVAAYCKGD